MVKRQVQKSVYIQRKYGNGIPGVSHSHARTNVLECKVVNCFLMGKLVAC